MVGANRSERGCASRPRLSPFPSLSPSPTHSRGALRLLALLDRGTGAHDGRAEGCEGRAWWVHGAVSAGGRAGRGDDVRPPFPPSLSQAPPSLRPLYSQPPSPAAPPSKGAAKPPYANCAPGKPPRAAPRALMRSPYPMAAAQSRRGRGARARKCGSLGQGHTSKAREARRPEGNAPRKVHAPLTSRGAFSHAKARWGHGWRAKLGRPAGAGAVGRKGRENGAEE
jgi:hypothetical protein